MSVFIQPPSVKELRKRLKGRGTDAPEVIESRIAKAEFELGFADKFDTVIVNDDLEKAKAEALKVIKNFIENKTMIKDPKKLAQRMSILCILIGFIALTVGIIAMAMEQYIIAIAMGIVTVGQVWNYNKWKRVR